MRSSSIRTGALFALRRFSAVPAVMVALCVPGLIFITCSFSRLAGVGSEVTNGTVIGSLSNTDGSPAMGARVMLIPNTHDPVKDGPVPDSLVDTADEAGGFAFRAASATMYTIEAIAPGSGDRALITGVSVNQKDTLHVPARSMNKPGTIKVMLPAGVDALRGYVYIPGTVIFAFLNNRSDFVTLDSVPAGAAPSVSYSSTSTASSSVIGNGIQVTPLDTTTIWNSAWKHAGKLVLNTAESGAGIAGNVVGFPVLVRLNSKNFDFSQAQATGADIRFTKSNGTPAPYQIERWDAAGQRAEVWVKVDTVYGNDSTQSLTIYWGASAGSATLSLSNGPAVFDTANGFQGVWHLSEAGSAIAKDATGNHYDGAPSDTAPAGAEGAIGPCRSFNGSSNYLRMNGTANGKLNFSENGVYTVSAWTYTDSLDNGYHVIVGKGNEQYYLKFKPSVPNSPMVWEFVEYYDKAGYNITNSLPSVPSSKTWSYLVGVRKGTQQYLYINGSLADSTPNLNSWAAPRNAGDDVTIGKFISAPADTTGGKCPFFGKIDEVRISNTANNADWIKLCYKNQKEPDALVKW